jgi:hypothetical protein
VPALIKPEQIVEALLRTAGERPAAAVAMQGACLPLQQSSQDVASRSLAPGRPSGTP